MLEIRHQAPAVIEYDSRKPPIDLDDPPDYQQSSTAGFSRCANRRTTLDFTFPVLVGTASYHHPRRRRHHCRTLSQLHGGVR
jgi:hypothetical protein